MVGENNAARTANPECLARGSGLSPWLLSSSCSLSTTDVWHEPALRRPVGDGWTPRIMDSNLASSDRSFKSHWGCLARLLTPETSAHRLTVVFTGFANLFATLVSVRPGSAKDITDRTLTLCSGSIANWHYSNDRNHSVPR